MKKYAIISLLSLYSLSSFAYKPWQENNELKEYLRLDSGFVVKQQIERNDKNNKYKTNQTAIFGGAIGWQFVEEFRGEISGLYIPPVKTTFTKSSGRAELKTSHLALIANIYYAPTEFNNLSPYIFFGAGMARNRTSTVKDFDSNNILLNEQSSNTNNHIAWNAGLGLTFEMSEQVKLDVGYRYLDLGTIKTSRQGIYGPSSVNNGKSHNDTTYNYNFGKARSSQITLAIRYYLNHIK